MNITMNIVSSLRISQWTKNLLVFSPLIFSGFLHAPDKGAPALLAFVAYCLAASGTYLFNDITDIRSDRAHPVKRSRPLASGELSVPVALLVSVILFAGSLLLAYYLGVHAGITVSTYVILNIAYSLLLKRIVIIDILCVAAGFLLRIWTGAIVIGVVPSEWLLLSTLLLALLISVGKRKSELITLGGQAHDCRGVLGSYSVEFLNQVLGVTTATAILAFAIYAITQGEGRSLICLVVFVIYGLFRYLYLLEVRRRGADPLDIISTDLPSIVNGCAWILTAIYLIYLR